MAENTQVVVTLAPDELQWLEGFRKKNEVDNLADAILLLLHDRWWDDDFANSQDFLNKLAAEALEEDRKGNTVDLEFDEDGNLL